MDFLDAVCDLQFKKERGFFLIPADGGYDYTGYVIAIIYSDGSYDIIAESGLYSYVIGKNGKAQHKYDPSDYCGSTPWTDFVKQYIEE